MIGSKVTAILLHWCKDNSAHRHCRNCNLTAESLQISTRRPQTSDKALGTLCCKCCTQEVLFVFIVLFVPAFSVVSFYWQDRREPNTGAACSNTICEQNLELYSFPATDMRVLITGIPKKFWVSIPVSIFRLWSSISRLKFWKSWFQSRHQDSSFT